MKRFLTLALMLSVGIASFAQEAVSSAEQASMIKRMETAAQAIVCLQCDFEQEKQLSLLNDKLVSKGIMYFKQPHYLYWEYTEPSAFTFVLNGTKVLLKSNQKKDVIDVKSSQLFQEIVRIMMNSVTGRCLSDKDNFNVTMYKEKKEWIARLIPLKKNMKQMFSSIQLHILPEQGIVNKVDMTEKTGDTTVIRLKNIKKNEKINENVFHID